MTFSLYNDDQKNRRRVMGTPGVPMVINQPAKLDKLFDVELAARLCREYTEEAVERLVEHMRDPAEPQVSLAATKMILDRGYGKETDVKAIKNQQGGDAPKYKIQIEFVDAIDNMKQAERPHAAPTPVFEE